MPMRGLRQFIIILFLFLTFPAWADQLIVEPDMGREPILRAINETHYSLNLVMYGLTDKTLLDAIIEQKSHGKTVKVILEDEPYKAEDENRKAIQAFSRYQIDWRGEIPPYRLIHQKTLVIDGRKAVIMTFNFTNSAFKKDRNFALIIDDPKRVKEIASTFSSDWNHLATHTHSSDMIWSPDNSRQQLLTLISQAKSTIKIYAQGLSDYKIIGALAKAAKKGVTIEILTSGKLREKQADFLTRAGITIHYSKHYYIHAKVIIIDNQKAVLGSINFTRASLDDNRELSIVTEDPDVIKQLSATFAKDWNETDVVSTKQAKNLLPDKQTMLRVLRLMKRYIEQN